MAKDLMGELMVWLDSHGRMYGDIMGDSEHGYYVYVDGGGDYEKVYLPAKFNNQL